MVAMESEDLGLSLGLSSACTPTGLHLRRPPLRLSPPGGTIHHVHEIFSSLCYIIVLGDSVDSLLLDHGLRRIDVNRAPPSEVEEAVSSPNSAASGVSAGKRAGREEQPAIAEEPACSRGCSDDEDGGDGGDGSRKKLRLSKEQSAVLEESFKEHNTLNPKQKQALAKKLNLRPRQVEVWFQNRRARTKLKQTEVDCEYLRSCYENLTEENRRLQKEVQELRALKLSPHLYMHMTPPTTLTMCPACERVAAATSSKSSRRPS